MLLLSIRRWICMLQDAVRRGIIGLYRYSKDLCEMWFILQKRVQTDERESGFLVMLEWPLRVVSLIFPAVNCSLSCVTSSGWHSIPLNATLSVTNQPAHGHSCQFCRVAYGRLSNNDSCCYVIFITMWLCPSDGKSEPAPVPEADVTMPH